MTAPFYQNYCYHSGHKHEWLRVKDSLEMLAQSTKPAVKYKFLHNAQDLSEVCAVICGTAVADDILLPLNVSNHMNPLLVLRQGSENNFDVVGQCICFWGYSPYMLNQYGPRDGRNVFTQVKLRCEDQNRILRARVQLVILREELIVLTGRWGKKNGRADGRAPEDWFQRLATNPLLFPEGAVTITPINEGENYSNDHDYEYEGLSYAR